MFRKLDSVWVAACQLQALALLRETGIAGGPDVKVYLDVCCIGRLTDDQSQARLREEAEAVERVFAGVRRGSVVLISSEALEDEVRCNASTERRVEAQVLLGLAASVIEIDEPVTRRARELNGLGYGPFDSLHLAAAESGGADVLLTTDDRLLRRAARGLGKPRTRVENPVLWIREQGL